MCQNTTMRVYGAWIKSYYVLYPTNTSGLDMRDNPPLIRDKPLGAPASVKLVYNNVISDCDANIVKFALNGFVGRSDVLRVFMPINVMNHHAINKWT